MSKLFYSLSSLNSIKASAVFILLLQVCILKAQTPSILLFSSDSSYRQSSSMIQLHGNGLIGSNALDNNFFKKSILGGHLDEAHLEDIYGEMKTRNRAGFLANGGINFYNFTDTVLNKPHWGLRAGISTNYHANVSFHQNLFKTIYLGNKSFAGQTATLGPLNANYQAWQKFSVGVFNKKTWSALSLSLVAGQQYQSLDVNHAALFTSQTGDSLSLSYSGQYLRSDSLKKSFANGSGLGLAIDFEINLPLQDNKSIISISVQDVGFIAWNKRSQQFNFDSLTTWTGLEVGNLFNLTTDTLDFPNLKDSLHHERKNTSFVAPLPASVHLRYGRYFAEKHLYEIGISIWSNRTALPMVYAGASQFLTKQFMLSERISYGGYGRLGIGIEAQWMPYNTWLIRAGTNHIEGFISKNTYSTSAYFTLAKFFGRVEENEDIEN